MPDTGENDAGLTPDQRVATFKFYEEAAEKTKAHAWSQTTWILALNAGIFAFSLKFYAEHASSYAFILIELICACVGIALCGFLIYLLKELGGHISHYWTTSNKIAAGYAPLNSFIAEADLVAAKSPTYRAPFPQFCRRLQRLTGLFLLAHVGWACFAGFVLSGQVTASLANRDRSQQATTNVFIYITQPGKTN